MRNLMLVTCIGILVLPLAACNEQQDGPVTAQTFGPSPTLPAPQSSWVPTVNVAKAIGWSNGGKPTAAVLANAPLGLVGFAGACIVLHFTAEPLGSAIGLALALATSVGWSLMVLLARRHGIAV